MSATVCFTSLTWNYAARARVLAGTLRAAHPDWRLWAVLVDRPPPDARPVDVFDGFDRVILAEDLGIPLFRSWMFRHDLVEACTAVKGAMLRMLLARGAARVIYLDPDIAVFHPLAAVEAALDEFEIVLTPHQTIPSVGARAEDDNEFASLRYGAFNLGFLAVRPGEHGTAFAHWWAARLANGCYDEPERGIFTDQKYCDLVPGLFGAVGILRHPGCNVASWNLAQRRVAFTAGGAITVDGERLQFYHFSKSGGPGDAMTARYAGGNVAVQDIWAWYKRAIEAMHTDPHPWFWGHFEDGAAIPRAARLIYRRNPELTATYRDPFATGSGCFRDWLISNAPDTLDRPA